MQCALTAVTEPQQRVPQPAAEVWSTSKYCVRYVLHSTTAFGSPTADSSTGLSCPDVALMDRGLCRLCSRGACSMCPVDLARSATMCSQWTAVCKANIDNGFQWRVERTGGSTSVRAYVSPKDAHPSSRPQLHDQQTKGALLLLHVKVQNSCIVAPKLSCGGGVGFFVRVRGGGVLRERLARWLMMVFWPACQLDWP